MPLDPESTIAPTQSASIRAAIKIIVAGVIELLVALGFSPALVEQFQRYGNMAIIAVPILYIVANNVWQIYLAFRVIKPRINATETIRKEPEK